MRTAQQTDETGVEEVTLYPPGPASYAAVYWLISHPGHDPAAMAVPRLAGGGRILPVFSSREEATEFLRLQNLPGCWRIEAADAGGLLSVLLGPYGAGVEIVTLDPIPGVSEAVSAHLVGVDVWRFTRQLARRRVGELA